MAWEKKYMLQGFGSREEAQKRNHEFALKAGIPEESETKFMFEVQPLFQEHWGLVVQENHLNLLEGFEKHSGRLIEILPPSPPLNAFIPMVVRYLEKEFVDLFFEKGILRLSSFRKFHNHLDEQRGDKKEGNNIIVGQSKTQTVFSAINHGNDAFVLSTSLVNSKSLMGELNYNSGFVIEDPLKFIQLVGNKLSDLKGLLFGPCLYQENKMLKRKIQDFSMDSLKNEDGLPGIDMNKLFALSNQAGGNDVFFSKTYEYLNQHEFRFLWFVWSNGVSDFIDIECPEARECCSIIE